METVFHEADAFFGSLGEALREARHHVTCESYIFEKDALGRKLLKELYRAAARGVKVRLVVDGVGSPAFGAKCAAKLARRGITLDIHHPLPWQLCWSRPWRALRSALHGLWMVNRRNHRKTWDVDGHVFFTGSFNVAAVHSRRFSGARAWRDSGVRLCLRQGPALLRLNHTESLRGDLYRDLLGRIGAARRRIWITTPYFVPPHELRAALVETRRRGVDVRLLVPEKCDLWAFPLINALHYRGLVDAGVEVHEFIPRVLHAKTMLVDDWAMLGSTNLNSRSLRHDLETDVVVRTPEAVASLENQFLDDLRHSRRVGNTDILRTHGGALATFPFWRMLSYWL